MSSEEKVFPNLSSVDFGVGRRTDHKTAKPTLGAGMQFTFLMTRGDVEYLVEYILVCTRNVAVAVAVAVAVPGSGTW
jgi:hypothetical protein